MPKIDWNSRRAFFFLALIATAYRLLLFKGARLGGYDEQIYLSFMYHYSNEGVAGIQKILHMFPTDPVLLQSPLPLRFLFVLAGTWACQLFGEFQLAHVAKISLASGIATVCVGYALFKKWFTPPVAYLGGLLLVVSPLATGLGRRALQDSFFCLLVVCAIYYFDAMFRKKQKKDLVLFGVFLTTCFLTKETTLLLYPVFLALWLYYANAFQERPATLPVLAVFCIAPLIYLSAMWWLAGNLGTFFSTYFIYADMQTKIEYARDYQRGPWFRYMIDLLLLSPLAGLFSVLSIAFREPWERKGWQICALYCACILVVFSSLVLLNVRTITFIDVPLRGLAAVCVFGLSNRLPRFFSRGFWIVLLAALLISTDVVQFFRVYYLADLYDPTTHGLMKANGFIP